MIFICNTDVSINNNSDVDTVEDVVTSESDCPPKLHRRQKKKQRIQKVLNKNKIYNNSRVIEDTIKTTLNDRLTNELKRCHALTPPLRQHIKLNLSENQLIPYLKHYLLNENDLKSQGYPYYYGSKAAFFKQNFGGRGSFCAFSVTPIGFDVNAREFIPNRSRKVVERKLSVDSGQASGNTSSSLTDSDSSDNLNELRFSENSGHSEKKCARCNHEFYVNESGEYLRSEKCKYHWGKFCGKYTCCESEKYSVGCTQADEHVWTGYENGFNGPLDGFVSTDNSCKKENGNNDMVFALDTEMCFTGLGLECTKVTLVTSDGSKIYEKYIRPANKIICYNTRFSGVTKKDLSSKNGLVSTLSEVQQDLLNYIDAETILIGHALENDLRSLKIIHKNVIDTSLCFPHPHGPGFKHSLRTLTQQYLRRTIQDSDQGHSSFEDSRAALELILWRIRKDFRSVLEY